MATLFKRVDTVFCYVKNLEKAKEWYAKVLGFPIRFENDYICCLNVSETSLTLIQAESQESFQPAKHAYFNFYVQNMEEAREHLLQHGVTVSEIFHEPDVDWLWFLDLDGNRLELCSF